jgi:hypothetical protein
VKKKKKGPAATSCNKKVPAEKSEKEAERTSCHLLAIV